MAGPPPGLSVADVQGVLDAVRKVMVAPSLDEFRTNVLAAVRGAIPCDGVGYNEVDPRIPRVVALTDPRDYASSAPAEAFARHMHEHPLLAYTERTGDGSAKMISDFLSTDEFHALDLYREFYALIGVEYQLAITLPTVRPLLIAVVVTRADRDFSERDRLVLDALRQHLVQAYRNAEAHNRLRADLDSAVSALEGSRRSVAIIDDDGALRFVSQPSASLEDYLGDATEVAEVARWIEAEQVRLRTTPELPDTSTPLVIERPTDRLVVRFVRRAGPDRADLVLFDERPLAVEPAVLEGLGLTRREATVLALVAEGNSNAVIAARLGIRENTVKKHLERVFVKLGVSSRTQAAGAVFDAVTGLLP